ncbi:hypothetical protein FB468_1396 [Leucobacter komagatae]|uniref:Uncharacterized protein n=1 Tax=Leucobacter komagatae TaxID=55969 RepID=A0A542Y5R3_9MICO|nr:hypothetical protein FB468_1396 [Leucobacter komagatae]
MFHETPETPISFDDVTLNFGEDGTGLSLWRSGGATVTVTGSAFIGGAQAIAIASTAEGRPHNALLEDTGFRGQEHSAVQIDDLDDGSGNGRLTVRNYLFEGISTEGLVNAPLAVGELNDPTGYGSPQMVVESSRFVGTGGGGFRGRTQRGRVTVLLGFILGTALSVASQYESRHCSSVLTHNSGVRPRLFPVLHSCARGNNPHSLGWSATAPNLSRRRGHRARLHLCTRELR